MKSLTLLFCSLFVCLLSHVVRAQEITVKMVMDSMHMDSVSRQQLLYSDDSISVMLQVKAKKGYIVKFRNCCGEVQRVEMNNKIDTDRGIATFLRAEQMGSNIVLFYTGTEPSGWFLYGWRIDMHTFILVEKPDQLAHAVQEAPQIEISPDHSKVLVHYVALYKAEAAWSVEVYSDELNLVWRKLNYVHPGALIGAIGYAVNNNGDVAYLNVQKVDEAVLNHPGNNKIRCYAINHFSEGGNTYTPYFFDEGEYYFPDLRITFNADGKPVVTGFFRRRNSLETGVFTATPGDRNAAQFTLYRFSEEFAMESLNGKDRKKYRDQEKWFVFYMNALKIVDVVTGSDKAVYVVGEVRDYSAQATFAYPFSFGSTAINSGDKINSEIIVTKIDSVGRLLWTKRIVRAFLLDGDEGVSAGVRCFEFDGNLAVLMNDHPKNSVLRSGTETLNVAQDEAGMRCATAYIFGQDGQLTKTEFNGANDEAFVFDLSRSCIIGTSRATLFWSMPGRFDLMQIVPRK